MKFASSRLDPVQPSASAWVSQAALRGETKHPPTNGSLEMGQAIADMLQRLNTHCFMADEVLMNAPFSGQNKDIVLILGGQPVALNYLAKAGFRATPNLPEAAITPRTRCVVPSLTSNSAGAMDSDDALRALGAVQKNTGMR